MTTENPNGIIGLLRRIGEENIKVQPLISSMRGIQQKKNGDSQITFETCEITPTDVMNQSRIGIVLWMSTESFQAATRKARLP